MRAQGQQTAALELLDRAGGLVEHLGGLLDGEVAEDAQRDHRALVVAEPVEHLVEVAGPSAR